MEKSKKIQKIGFIGSGKVATNMAMSFENNGFEITQIFSPNIKHSQKLAEKVNAESIASISGFNKNLDIIIISISDTAVSQLDLASIEENTLICHTSGSLDISILSERKNYGVFYPLQTFSNQRYIVFSNIPICVEANNNTNLERLLKLGLGISKNVSEINSQKRSTLHLAAVFVCNFTNAMYAIGEDILQDADIDFNLLRPLIDETANKVKHHSPNKMQTGPALRGDTIIMNKHIEALNKRSNYMTVYKLMSKIINEENKTK